MSCKLRQIDEAIAVTNKSGSAKKAETIKTLEKMRDLALIANYQVNISSVVVESDKTVDEVTAEALDKDNYYQGLVKDAEEARKATDASYTKAKDSLVYKRDAKVTDRVKGDRKEGKGVVDRATVKIKALGEEIEELQSFNISWYNKIPGATEAEKTVYKGNIEGLKTRIKSLKLEQDALIARRSAAESNSRTSAKLFDEAEAIKKSSAEAQAKVTEHRMTYSTAGQVILETKVAGTKNKKADSEIDEVSLADYFIASNVSIDLPNMKARLEQAINSKEGDRSTYAGNVEKARGWVVEMFAGIKKFANALPPVFKNEVADGGVEEGYQNIVRSSTSQESYNKYGDTRTEINDTLNKAASIAFVEWAANIGGAARASTRSNDDSLRMLGKTTKETLSTSERDLLSQFDGVVPEAARMIGREAMKMLGLKAKEGSTELETSQFKAKLEIELGLMALKGAEKAGIIKLNDTKVDFSEDINKLQEENAERAATNEDNTLEDIIAVRQGEFRPGYAIITSAIYGDKTTDKGTTATFSFTNEEHPMLNRAESAVSDLLTALGDTKRTTGLHLSPESAATARDSIVNQGVSNYVGDVPAVQKDAIIKQSATANWFDDGYTEMLDKVLEESGEDTFLEMLGMTDENGAYVEDRAAIRGKNEALRRSLKHLQDAREEVAASGQNNMWFKWYVVTNGRFGIKSNTFNIQDQKLHRNSVSNAAITVDTKQKEEFLKMSMAQGFDISVDKLTKKAALEKFDAYAEELVPYVEAINNGDKNAYTKALKFVTSSTGEPEHAMRALSEFISYYNWNDNGRKGKLISGMTLETDAITSGYILKIMQMPIFLKEDGTIDMEKVKLQLEKGGVFDHTTDADGKMTNPTYGEWKMNKENKDSYETAGKAFGEELAKATEPENMVFRLGKEHGKKKYSDLTTKQQTFLAKIAEEDKVKTQAIMALLGEGNVVDGFIAISRAFMKNPFMIFNYGSAISSIVNAEASKTTENIFKRMTAIGREEDNTSHTEIINALKASEYQLSKDLEIDQKAAKTIINGQLVNLEKAIEEGGDKVLELKFDKRVLAAVEATARNVISKPLTATFKSEYSEYMEAGKTINTSMAVMAKVALRALDKRILEEVAKKNKDNTGRDARLSPKEIDALVLGMRDEFPVLNMPLGDGDASKILLMKTAQGSYTPDHEYNVEARSGFKDFKGESSMYKLVESFTSGAVIPIHFMDGSIQSRVLSMFTALGVHDANLFNLENMVEGTKEYNKAAIELAKSYSLSTEVMNSFVDTLNKATAEDLAAIDTIHMEQFIRNIGKFEEGSTYTNTKLIDKSIQRLKNKLGELTAEGILGIEVKGTSKSDNFVRDIQAELETKSPTTISEAFSTVKKLQETSEEGRYQLFNNNVQYIEHSALEGAGYVTPAEAYSKKVPKELVSSTSNYLGTPTEGTATKVATQSPLDNIEENSNNTVTETETSKHLTPDEMQSMKDANKKAGEKICKTK